MLPYTIIRHTAIGLALSTTLGVLIHDTKIDKATTVALSVPVLAASVDMGMTHFKLGGEAHTHVERVSLSNAVRDLQPGTPRIQPRDDAKKFHLQKNVAKGVHAFDGYYMPLGAI
ncbi:hypothetical protein A2707_04520 [Candidatus Saccharibacteria bacterium RIFCSPHIGHO2_01_FULL_45_15]|nr:MAG: hypothetical protein A2707_04520 [Candidatus Saccharibacteria bacterium RIFCSPHIGHO2_01_FULL_45_15]OGL27196.1 MAG: hypothetical protein A3C39_01405 [Candidatus Saccharibacteria bacterium RIFCSPHIGHO2_02_FULL_46_12]OGL32761.1 MAG: hypothetical protein A3E76_05440 [Candidatus Saccharibacteria bacterium RIFCSPHIGHO2_12_FULL_44_22]